MNHPTARGRVVRPVARAQRQLPATLKSRRTRIVLIDCLARDAVPAAADAMASARLDDQSTPAISAGERV
jgi:hypothetical protein